MRANEAVSSRRAMTIRRLAGICGLLLAVSCAGAAPPGPVTAIYYHGNILTGVELDGGSPERVTALAIGPHQVLAAGSDASILPYKQPATQLIDLHGAFVMPGLNDAHVHLAFAGQQKLAVDLTGCRTLAEMLERIRARAAEASPGQWLLGGGWDHTLWPDKRLPSRQDLDRVTGGHPAIFDRVDGHIAIADSTALSASGVTSKTPDPAGGRLDRDDNGELTGIVREGPALRLIRSHIPALQHDIRREALVSALQDAASHGVTSVQDNSDWEDFLILQELERAHQLPVRVSEWLHFDDSVAVLNAHRAAQPATDRMLRTGMLKALLDGSLGSRTAALNAPYTDDPGNTGLPRYEQSRLNAMAKERAAKGFQLGFHAIGDRAVGMALDAFAATGSTAARRNRIEHSQVVDPQDVDRYKKLGAIASMQPSHLLTDMNWAQARLGRERAEHAYTWKAFLDAGVPLAFGTDYPVEPVSPFRGIYSAVTRSNESGSLSYFPQYRLSIQQTLFAYTQGSAFAEFAETWKGKLAPGFVADFVVLDRDLTAVPSAEVLKTRVLRTVVDGQTVFSLP